jgi:hypothetical protein
MVGDRQVFFPTAEDVIIMKVRWATKTMCAASSACKAKSSTGLTSKAGASDMARGHCWRKFAGPCRNSDLSVTDRMSENTQQRRLAASHDVHKHAELQRGLSVTKRASALALAVLAVLI